MTKFATIALVGAPNAGKSTLTNCLLGQKLSIVSPKVQTTRNTIKAIIVEDDTQLVLLDTPGVFIPRGDKTLERSIVRIAWQGIRSAQLICLLIDGTDKRNYRELSRENLEIIEQLKKDGFEPIVAINKVDAVKKENLLPLIKQLTDLGIEKIFMISALTADGVSDLKKFLLSKCEAGPWLYDADQITDAPMRFTASEITREKIFLLLHEELPYSVAVKTDSYEVFANGDLKIKQTIYVLKENQKNIVIGKKGQMLKAIGEEARHDIGEIAQARVHLFLFVKVKEDWMNDQELLSSI